MLQQQERRAYLEDAGGLEEEAREGGGHDREPRKVELERLRGALVVRLRVRLGAKQSGQRPKKRSITRGAERTHCLHT